MYKVIAFDQCTDGELQIAAHFTGGLINAPTPVQKCLSVPTLSEDQRLTLIQYLKRLDYQSVRINVGARVTRCSGESTQYQSAWPTQYSEKLCAAVDQFLTVLGFKDLMLVPRYGSDLMTYMTTTSLATCGRLLAKQNAVGRGVKFKLDGRARRLWDSRAQKHFDEEVFEVRQRGKLVGFFTVRKYDELDKLQIELQDLNC